MLTSHTKMYRFVYIKFQKFSGPEPRTPHWSRMQHPQIAPLPLTFLPRSGPSEPPSFAPKINVDWCYCSTKVINSWNSKAMRPELWHGDDWQNFAFSAHPSTVSLFHTYKAKSIRRPSTYKSCKQPMKLWGCTSWCLPAEWCPKDNPPSWNGPVRSRNRWHVSVTSRHLKYTQLVD